MPPLEKDHSQWDLRFLQWISRDSQTSKSKRRSNPLLLALHLPLVWGTAAFSGPTYWLVLAIIATVIPVGMYLEKLRKRSRRTSAATNPFGQ
jgi:hypothetical protein